MQNLVTIWQNLGLRRQIIVAGATFAMFAAILLLAQSAAAPKMALLYSGLDRAAAGDVIAALEQSGEFSWCVSIVCNVVISYSEYPVRMEIAGNCPISWARARTTA